MTEKKRRSARALRDKKRMTRYWRTHGYRRFAGDENPDADVDFYRGRVILTIAALLLFGLGLFYVIF